MLDTGLRRGELAGLRVGDLNLSQMVACLALSPWGVTALWRTTSVAPKLDGYSVSEPPRSGK